MYAELSYDVCRLLRANSKKCTMYEREVNIEPQAVAVSPYGWLMTHYGWLAGLSRLAAVSTAAA